MFMSKAKPTDSRDTQNSKPNADESPQVPICEKYLLTIKEASLYFNLGQKKLYSLADENLGRFAINNGNRVLIIRTKFEKFINESSTV